MPASPALQKVQREIELRKIAIAKAKANLVDFAEYIDENYHAERHHRLVGEKLMEVFKYLETDGEEGINRLMIFMPPGSGKSELVCRKFPAWAMGQMPSLNVIHASYGADLAYEDSAQVRDAIQSQKYQDIFGERSPVVDEDMPPVLVDKRYAAKSEWRLRGTRGRYVASGIGGAITGKHGNLMIIDDPYKNRDEADSEANRNRIWRWYQSTFRTRLLKPGAIVVLHTRWDRDDLAGHLLANSVGSVWADEWEVVMLPALALEENEYPKDELEMRENLSHGIYIPMGGDQLGRKPGEALNPNGRTVEDYKKIEHDVDDEFMPLFQQLPEDAKGAFFQEEWFEIKQRSEIPANLDWYSVIDLALGKTQTSDFNCSGPIALDEKGNFWLRDALHIRELREYLGELKVQMLSDEEIGTAWRFEDVLFQSVVLMEFLEDPDLAGIDIDRYSPTKDKVLKARPLRGRARQGKVFLVDGDWVKDFIKEAVRFPKGKHDDFIDWVASTLEVIVEEAGSSRNGGIHV